ncbi:hypothetical protein WR25_04434 [Diploscapter pachys]|uniref:Uncharacterized protein n=1 Tax=Diploscapter pachys TaxID=2018661 RepID=A0A2A2LG38_9BILA|nr:hypothetical protein WR25_04434 [Diploscapter pachys]
MNKLTLTVDEWQNQLSRLRECSDQVETEHNIQILLTEILFRIRSSDNSIKGFIEVYLEMVSEKQAYNKKWLSSSDEKKAVNTAVGRFEERQKILNNEHLLPLATSLSSFEAAFVTTSIHDTPNGILIIETIREFTKLIRDLRDYIEKHSEMIVPQNIEEIEMLKGRMTSLKRSLENIEFKAREQQEKTNFRRHINKQKKKREEELKKKSDKPRLGRKLRVRTASGGQRSLLIPSKYSHYRKKHRPTQPTLQPVLAISIRTAPIQ